MVYLKIIDDAIEAFGDEDALNKYTDGTYDLSLEDEEWVDAGGQSYLDSDGNIVIGPELATVQTKKLAALESAFLTWLNDTATMVSSLGFTADADDRAVTDIAGLAILAAADSTYTTTFMDADNVAHEVDATDIATLQSEVIQSRLYMYQQKWTYRAAIEAATSVSELADITIKFTPSDFSETE